MGGEVNEFAFWGDMMGLEHEDDALKAYVELLCQSRLILVAGLNEARVQVDEAIIRQLVG